MGEAGRQQAANDLAGEWSHNKSSSQEKKSDVSNETSKESRY